MKVVGIESQLEKLMTAKGVSQSVLAEETGLAVSTVARLAKNRFDRVDIQTIIKLCNYFGLKSIDALFTPVLKFSDCSLSVKLLKDVANVHGLTQVIEGSDGTFANLDSKESRDALISQGLARLATYEEVYKAMLEQHQKQGEQS